MSNVIAPTKAEKTVRLGATWTVTQTMVPMRTPSVYGNHLEWAPLGGDYTEEGVREVAAIVHRTLNEASDYERQHMGLILVEAALIKAGHGPFYAATATIADPR